MSLVRKLKIEPDLSNLSPVFKSGGSLTLEFFKGNTVELYVGILEDGEFVDGSTLESIILYFKEYDGENPPSEYSTTQYTATVNTAFETFTRSEFNDFSKYHAKFDIAKEDIDFVEGESWIALVAVGYDGSKTTLAAGPCTLKQDGI